MTRHQDVQTSKRYDKVCAVLMTAKEPLTVGAIRAVTNMYDPVIVSILENMLSYRLVERKLIKKNKREVYVYWLARRQELARKIVNRQTGWYNARVNY